MTCKDEPLVWPAKEPGSTEDFGVDFTDRLTRWWKRRTDITGGVRYRAPGLPGFEIECSSAGQTGNKEPLWPTTLGVTVNDGSVEWTVRAVSTSSLVTTISGTPVWAGPTALTISGEGVSGQIATALITGGTDGEDHEVTVTATCADTQVIVQRCILPIRTPSRDCPC